ncbi:MAG: DUF4159 domain-containing protein [Phycisphaerales bacterium]|nr:DUF4159 domain-containing protein [Phycisphaerales bacterium]
MRHDPAAILRPRLAGLVVVGVTLLVRSVLATPVTLGPADLDDTHIEAAITSIVEALYVRKHARHYWDPPSWDPTVHGSRFQRGGYTAMTVLAMLYAGQSYQDPRLADAIAHLEGLPMEGTYAVAFRLHVWAKLPPSFQPRLEQDAQWLLDGFSPRAAGWAYEQRPATTRKDNSIRQYGALALWEAAKRGIEIPDSVWRRLEHAFLECQQPDGGWNYKGDEQPSTGSMTTAGLATLFITQDLLHAERSRKLGGDLPPPVRAAMDGGLAWMNQHFSPQENPGSLRDLYYYLYGVERVGLAGGHTRFGGRDWFREGAAELIRRLCEWDPDAGTMTVYDRVAGDGRAARIRTHHLAYALMFLSRGRVPVAVNKLHAKDFATDNRPRDAANLTRWLTEATERELSWQIADASEPPESWLDAPLLYVASNEPWPGVRDYVRETRREGATGVTPLPASLRRIRRYLDLGGLLVAVHEGGGSGFAESVRALGSALYPSREWRRLPADHPAYQLHHPITRRPPPLEALSNGVRELIILAPRGDLSATFQMRDERRQVAFETMGNLYLYASEMDRPHPRLKRTTIPPPLRSARRTITLVQASYDGHWNAEPAALQRFADGFDGGDELAIRVITHPLSALGEIEPAPTLVVVSGVSTHAFTAAERQAVRRFLAPPAGSTTRPPGIMLFETAGGRGDFTAAAETMAAELFNAPIRSVRREPVVTGSTIDGGFDLTRVEYRPFALEVFGARETTPRLRGMDVGGLPRLLFSREDLSHGLLDQPTWGISGYAAGDARRLLSNIVRAAADLTAAPERVRQTPPPRSEPK